VSFDFPNDGWTDLRLLNAINAGAEIHAWNAPFEWAVWNNVMTRQGGYPALPIERFHCTMAAAANAGLPMGLGDAAAAIGSYSIKDKVGQALMKRMARPRGWDANGKVRWWHVEDTQKREALRAYNIADVEAERAISRSIPRMSPRERGIWLVDQHMNQRGMPVDHALLSKLAVITSEELLRLNREAESLTGGEITSLTQNARILKWLQDRGYPGTSLGKKVAAEFSVSKAFQRIQADAQEMLSLRREAAKTSTAKLASIAQYGIDGRARGLVQYAGAIRTLRWAGRGPQIQNFPKPVVEHTSRAIGEILAGMNADSLRHVFGRPLDVVSSCLRGVFKAPPGWRFAISDFKAIEAVVVAWLADFHELLDVFRRGEDVYLFTAAGVGSTNRQLGKVLRLACAYGMGGTKFQATAAGYGLDLTFMEADANVQGFRASNAPIVKLWHRYEYAARQAICNPGQRYPVGRVTFRMADPSKRAKGALLIEKPAGGYLVYRDAHIDDDAVCYWGVDQYTRKWTRIRTYGGKLVENVTQAVARDLLADVMVAFDREVPDTLVATIHDEIVALLPEAEARIELLRLKSLMSSAPAWAPGMPLSASGHVSDRYGKGLI
jgi:DNA polymerase